MAESAPQWLEKLVGFLGISMPLPVGGGMWAGVYYIGPELAEKILSKNRRNRNKKKMTISRYATDMEEDRWELTHQALAFDRRGGLRDGQNRMEAVIESLVGANFFVVFGLTESSVRCLDNGASRSALDAAKLADVDTTTLAIGTVKNAHNGHDILRKPISNTHALELIGEYSEGLQFVFDNVEKQRGVTSAAVCAAIVRAYYFYTDEDDSVRLERFCKVLSDGQHGGIKKDRIATQLRDKLLGEKYFGRQRFAYSLTEKAIGYFMTGKMVSRLIPVRKEMFPFDWELEEEENGDE